MPPEDDKKEEQKPTEEQGKQLDGLTPQQNKQVLIYLAQQNEALRKEMAAQRERIEKITPAPGGMFKQQQQQQAREEEPELEAMSRAQFASHILKSVEDKVARPIMERIGESDANSEKAKAAAELKEVISKNEDFWEYKDETKQVLEEYPQLTVGEALILARSRAPDKTKAIEAQRAEKEGKQKAADINKRKEAFGGLFPTSGKTADAKRMSAKDAAESAWESVGMGEHLAAIGE